MNTLSSLSNPPSRRYVIGIVVAHSVLLSLLCVLSLQSSGTGPPFAKLFLLSLLVSQSCLLAIWFAFSKASRRIRVCGLLLGVGTLLILSLCAIAASGPIHELLGLEFEWLVMPLAGVVIVLATLRRLDLELVSTPKQFDIPDLQPRISLIGLLSIMAVVAALFALRPVTQSLAAYDRLSLYVFMQTVALSGMTIAAIWTALSGGTPWLRLLALSTIVSVAAFFFGYLVVDERSVALFVTFSVILVVAAAIVVVSLLCIRQTGIRCAPENGRLPNCVAPYVDRGDARRWRLKCDRLLLREVEVRTPVKSICFPNTDFGSHRRRAGRRCMNSSTRRRRPNSPCSFG